jgi:cytochrome c-type protein NapB
MKKSIWLAAVAAFTFVLFSAAGLAQPGSDTLRKARVTEEPPPPRMATDENKDLKRMRAYPMQPPTIPHKIDDYQLDLNANKCMSCHARIRTADTQAPMISVTHYQDRDGNFLAELSPRRYFCTQCHVPQTDARPLVDNNFIDVDYLIRQQRSGLQKQR